MDTDDLKLLAASVQASLAAPQTHQPIAWRATGTNRVTLRCGGCPRRIAWWSDEIRPGWPGLQDAIRRGWRWQGPEVPVTFRGELVDACCPSCGWSREGVARQLQPGSWLRVPELL